MLIFEHSSMGRQAKSQMSSQDMHFDDIPNTLLRQSVPTMPQVSELQVVRHYTNLSKRNLCIDSNFYPLGSCTMKYNPRGVHRAVEQDNFANRHPYSLASASQGVLCCLYELQEYLVEITGMNACALSPMAGSQGEFAGIAMIQAYHQSCGDSERTEMLVPEAAHGTNPASAAMCGFTVREIPINAVGDIDIDALQKVVGPKTAGIMLTNPSTLGVFERDMQRVAQIIHQAGGLLYYDGANLNAILGKVRPGDMGFDVVHLNLHKTFATPHGGGGPGAGPVVCNKRLTPFLPIPRVTQEDDGYRWLSKKDCPLSIGRLSAFMGNVGILLRAYAYIRMLGREGLPRVAEFATLNANYLQAILAKDGFELAYAKRLASHEFIITLRKLAKTQDVSALDFAKRLLDFGVHAPTIYFPLLIPECFLIEPTETETKEELDNFIEIMRTVKQEALNKPEILLNAPHTTCVRRLDEVRAARLVDVVWQD